MKKRLLTLAVLFSMLTYPATVFAEETTNVIESGEEENEIEEPDPDDVDVSADIDASDSDTENDDAAEDGVEEEDSIEDGDIDTAAEIEEGDIDIAVNTEELTDLLEDQFLEEEIEEIEYEDPENLEEEYEEEELLAAADLTNPKHRDLDYPEAFPMAYDEDWLSYMKDRYPATRNQGFFGTCWAHAAIGYAEFYAINHGWADKSIDLSEAHLVYWTKNTAPDTVIDNDDQSKGYSYYGGSDHQIYYAFGHGLGPAPEGVVPYSEMMGMQYNNNELSEDTAYHSEMQLTRGYEVTDISEIKELVMKNGAVCTGMYMDNWFDRDNGCYYNNRDNYTNHAVLIVGWDDNYPRENFEPRWNPFTEEYMGKLPEYNGAWLIRNSYTTNTENSVNSYFWMSYEDTSVSEMYAKLHSGCTVLDLIEETDEFEYLTNLIKNGELDEHNTYIFELVGPKNQVVIKYDKAQLYHIGTRNNETGEELGTGQFAGYIMSPKEYPLHSLEDCISAAKELNKNDYPDNEGFVVVDKDYHRVKIKAPEYLIYHHTVNNGQITKERAYEILTSDDFVLNTFRHSVPAHVLNALIYYQLEIDAAKQKAAQIIELARQLQRNGADRKGIAEIIKTSSYSYFGFKALDNTKSAVDIIRENSKKLLGLIADYDPKVEERDEDYER